MLNNTKYISTTELGYYNLLLSPGPASIQQALTQRLSYSPFTDELTGPEYAPHTAYVNNLFALIKKNQLWTHKKTYLLGINALAAPVRPFNWCHPANLNDCYFLKNCTQRNPRTQYYRPTNITFKRRSRLLVRNARHALMHMYNLRPKPKLITKFARYAAQRSRATDQLTCATLHKMYYLRSLRLYSPLTSYITKNNLQLSQRQPAQLAISRYAYASIITTLDKQVHKSAIWQEQATPSYNYYQNIVFRGFKKRNLNLLTNTWSAFDLPRNVEVDYSTLTISQLCKKWATFGGWYGATLYTYWNFYHLYNWKFFY